MLGFLKTALVVTGLVFVPFVAMADDPDPVELFWVWFPDARGVLHEAKAFNNNNSSIPSSFDHLLNSKV